MPRLRPLLLAAALVAASSPVAPALARNPPNPYAGFNLSGVNYGAMQWERDQRAGKRVWPYYNEPTGGGTRAGVSAGGGAVVRQGGGRGWRRARR